MKIQITQEHIDKGAKGDCHACPIALALRDLGMESISVGDDCGNMDFWNPKKEEDRHCSLPDEALEFIDAFDEGARVEPFEFEIRD